LENCLTGKRTVTNSLLSMAVSGERASGGMAEAAGGRKEEEAANRDIPMVGPTMEAGAGVLGREVGSQLCTSAWLSPPLASVSCPLETWKTCGIPDRVHI